MRLFLILHVHSKFQKVDEKKEIKSNKSSERGVSDPRSMQ